MYSMNDPAYAHITYFILNFWTYINTEQFIQNLDLHLLNWTLSCFVLVLIKIGLAFSANTHALAVEEYIFVFWALCLALGLSTDSRDNQLKEQNSLPGRNKLGDNEITWYVC